MSDETSVTPTKANMPLLIALCVIGIITLHYGFLFILLAVLPSVIAWYMDHTPIKSVFKTVLACNIAGMLPPLAMMFSGNDPNPHSMVALMEEPRVWLIIYSAAAGGWILVFLCRFVAQFLVMITFDHRANTLERKQEKLLVEWGDKIKQKAAE